MRNRVKQILAAGTEAAERLKYRKHFPKPDGNLDCDWHIQQAAGWLVRAQDTGQDRGVAYGAPLGGGFLPSYPETTGYIIPTFLQLAQHYDDTQYKRRALEMGDWEISVQMQSGAVMAGKVSQPNPRPAIFNTGQVLLGWAALLRETPLM